MENVSFVKESPEFTYKIKVQAHHLNYAGHVGHDAIVIYIWEARVNLLDSIGASELDLGDGETGIVMKELTIKFKNEAFLFDELTVKTKIKEVSERGLRIVHEILRGETMIAYADTRFVSFNYRTRQPAKIPEAFLNALARAQGL